MAVLPIKGTYGALTRSTEDEHQAFMQALKGLTFTREEFLEFGPGIVFLKTEQAFNTLHQQEEARAKFGTKER